jgi:hypothetical protein
MVQEIVQLWEKNKNILNQHLAEKLHETHKKSGDWRGDSEQEPWTYKLLVRMIVQDILNGGESGHRYSSKIIWDEILIHEFVEDCHQGTLSYIIPSSSDRDYIYTRVSYGSCSLRDTLSYILDSQSLNYLLNRYCAELHSETPPDSYSQFFFKYEKEYYDFELWQVDDLMTLCLHIVQRMRWFCEKSEERHQVETEADDCEAELFDPDETYPDETYPETID